jgi:small subunit ribosomal protein S16
MSTRIRLRRMGSKKRPFFRVVVADQRSPRDGRFIENIGKYHPLDDPSVIEIDQERALHWLRVGAQPSDQVRNLMRKIGIWEEFVKERPSAATMVTERTQKERVSKKAKQKAAAAAAAPPPQETAPPPAAETPSAVAEETSPAAEEAPPAPAAGTDEGPEPEMEVAEASAAEAVEAADVPGADEAGTPEAEGSEPSEPATETADTE